jgi:DNA recombination protein RmuC
MSTAAILLAIAALLLGALIGFLLGHTLTERRQQRDESRLRAAFDSVAGETLRANSELFLSLARETLGREQAVAHGNLKEREAAIAKLVDPLRSALEKTDLQAQAMERERRDAYTALRTQIEGLAGGHAQLQRETRNLVTALRRPEVRGRWGEMTLRRVVELAGMTEHCDFTEQLNVVTDERASMRPDLVVHMPDARDLVVDVKTPLDAYLEAIEAQSESDRQSALKRHAQQVEARVRQLGAKNYWAQFEQSPEFVVLFLPGDQFFGAALVERPELFDTAFGQRVIIATPSTLIALLKTVALGWRQSAVAQNAAIIRDLGQDLHKRLATFVNHLQKVGRSLGSSVEAYNSAVGSLDRQILPAARRFTELGVTADAPLPPLEPVEQLARNATPSLIEGEPPDGDEPTAGSKLSS